MQPEGPSFKVCLQPPCTMCESQQHTMRKSGLGCRLLSQESLRGNQSLSLAVLLMAASENKPRTDTLVWQLRLFLSATGKLCQEGWWNQFQFTHSHTSSSLRWMATTSAGRSGTSASASTTKRCVRKDGMNIDKEPSVSSSACTRKLHQQSAPGTQVVIIDLQPLQPGRWKALGTFQTPAATCAAPFTPWRAPD